MLHTERRLCLTVSVESQITSVELLCRRLISIIWSDPNDRDALFRFEKLIPGWRRHNFHPVTWDDPYLSRDRSFSPKVRRYWRSNFFGDISLVINMHERRRCAWQRWCVNWLPQIELFRCDSTVGILNSKFKLLVGSSFVCLLLWSIVWQFLTLGIYGLDQCIIFPSYFLI